MALPCRDAVILALRTVEKRRNPISNRGGVLVRVGLIEVVRVKEGRVNADRMDSCGACHTHVVQGVAEVGGLGWCGGMTECGETAAQRRRVGLLLHSVVAVDRRTDQVGNAGAPQLPGNHLAVAGGDDAERNPCGDEALQRRVGAREEFRFVPLIGAVPNVGRPLDEMLGDAEGRVHTTPVRREGGPISLTSEGWKSEGFHHFDIGLIDVFGRINKSSIPVEQHGLHGLSVRRA